MVIMFSMSMEAKLELVQYCNSNKRVNWVTILFGPSAKVAAPSFFLNISVAHRNFPLCFGEFLERDGMTLRFSEYSNPISNCMK